MSQRLAHLEDGVIASEVARAQSVGDVNGDIEGRSVLAGLAAAGWEQAEDRFEAGVARCVVIAINVIGGRLPTAKDGSDAWSVPGRFFQAALSTVLKQSPDKSGC